MPGTQVPAPLQTFVETIVPSSQVGVEAHWTAEPANLHMPAPLQEPVRPQTLVLDSSGQSFRGSVVSDANAHVPLLLHERQMPLHSVAQQTPSVQ
jgi:hypothetical protein